MKKCIFAGLILATLVVSSRAADTNQTAALAFLATIANSENPLLYPVVLATNKPVWESSVSAGFSLTKGNSDTLLTTGSIKTRRKTAKSEFMLSVSGAYGESDSVENNEFLQGVTQYNHLFSKRFYGFLNAEGAHDGIADLQHRFAFSPGAGYYFVKTTNTMFAGEFGPGLITQRLGGVDTTYGSLRLAERFEYKLTNGGRMWQRAEILPQVNKFDNFLVNAEIGAEAMFTKTLSLRITLLDNFVNEPAPGRKDNDVKLISGVAYKF
jgi:putative salt-induced outer membrane protein YdiY